MKKGYVYFGCNVEWRTRQKIRALRTAMHCKNPQVLTEAISLLYEKLCGVDPVDPGVPEGVVVEIEE